MKIFNITLLAAVALSTAGCHHWHNPHHGDFCPPGQAKKGNC